MCALACAACSSDANSSTDAAIDATAACRAVFTGNFAEVAMADSCATIEGGMFALSIATTSLDAGLVVMIPLTGGSASSQTTTGWSATATRTVDHLHCVLDAGDGVVPHGSFELALTAAVHGTLVLDQPVRAEALADCGDPLTEHVEVAF